jgi:SNF2 family DNA or RNA helicase
VQVIALLLMEREVTNLPRVAEPAGGSPTLLIAPTSVLGNWQRELNRFAPGLKGYLHHGPERPQEAKAFKQAIAGMDLVITSYGLLRRDEALFHKEQWQRVVVDEAQNLKNPHAAQTKAVTKLKTGRRLALTGTPIENRLLDLWSLFHFLNPGYLGSATDFKKRFEQPIQREQDQARAATLKGLVQPFILRRLKSDKRIIQDLPEKVEQRVYCNLTPEQAALYQGVVDQVQGKLEAADGIQRKGLMLATLMRLKQICNHPAQFLQDGSPFSETRSHKLGRVAEMVQEVMAEGESLLLFTQFTEVGAALERLFRQEYRFPVHYLHGGTSRTQRDRMIQAFQDPASPPALFILSLKAGGVGITLTRANHVFHFDRWWNPAVENQATDRAYRIGQEKRVFVHKLVTLGTLEERIDRVLEEKQRLAESIVGSDEAWLTELDNDAFRRLIELNQAEAVME